MLMKVSTFTLPKTDNASLRWLFSFRVK